MITNLEQLTRLRSECDLNAISLDLTRFLRGNLPLYAIRSAIFSLNEGGLLIVRAPTSIDSVSLLPGRWSFQLITQLVAKGCEDVAKIVRCDIKERIILCQRTAPPLPVGPWSAAVIYSGSPSEREQLRRCVSSLWRQPEIANGGQLLVCGPSAHRNDIVTLTGAEYLEYDPEESAERFMIGAKKMAAISAMRHERVLICHTRIVLQPNALKAIPNEFDLCTPCVELLGKNSTLPYLDVGFLNLHSVALYSSTNQTPIFYKRGNWLEFCGTNFPYIDGALFCVRRSLAQAIPLSSNIAWGEGEDVEWCLRLLYAGKIIELVPSAKAVSQTSKMPRYSKWGHLFAYRLAAQIRRALQNIFAQINFRK